MQQHIGETGSVIVWHKTFECTRNTEMAKIWPDFADYLEALNSRVYDLMDIFKKNYYVDPKFKGSNSIKDVMPVLVPALDYKNLGVQNGTMAMVGWYKMVYGSSTDNEKKEIYKNLTEYCKLDTLAMVKYPFKAVAFIDLVDSLNLKLKWLYFKSNCTFIKVLGILACIIKVMINKDTNYAFVDSQNLNLGVKSMGWELDFRKFRLYLKNKYNVSQAYLFIGHVSGNEKLYTNLQKYGYILIFKPTLEYKKSGKQVIKGNVDAEWSWFCTR